NMFDTLLQVKEREPVPPRQRSPQVDRDLETICLKALAKDPARRYASAAELADDLKCYLAGEPIQARPTGRAEKAWRWCRRNPQTAGLAAAVVLLLVGVTAVSAWAAVSRERELHVQKAQLIRTSVRRIGWRHDAWEEVRKAAAIYRHDQNHRLWKEATAVLSGLDAKQVKWFEGREDYQQDASAIAFSHSGKSLLLGGATDYDGKPRLAARLWQSDAIDMRHSREKGAGPVALRLTDDTPLHLAAQVDPPQLSLWDVAQQQRINEYTFANEPKVERLARNTLEMAVAALSADGALVAAVAECANAERVLAV